MSALATMSKLGAKVVIDGQIRVPAWVVDLESFRQWTRTEEFPTGVRVDYLAGEVWVDMSKEQVFSHNQVKTEYVFVIVGLVKADRLGRFFADGLRVTCKPANLSAVPDGTFVSAEAFLTGRVQLVEGRGGGFVELEGTPDMVLEILSPASIQKDTEELRRLYWKAGIPEYWLVDARRDPPRFDILRRSRKGYVAVARQHGWVKSVVFGKSFCLTQQTDEQGYPDYSLLVR
jgi:Uma2 family endonuclease